MTDDARTRSQLIAEVKRLQKRLSKLETTAREGARIEEALRESEQRFRVVFESAADAILLIEGNRFVACNPRAQEIFARSREEIIGQPPYQLSPEIQPDGRDSREVALEKIAAARSGDPLFFEWRHRRPDGTLFDAEVSLRRVELDARRLHLALVRDITERKRAEEKIRKSEAHQGLVLRSLPMAFYTASPHRDSGFTWVSDQIAKVCGFSPEQFAADPQLWASRLHPEDRKRTLATFNDLADGGGVELEYRWQVAPGEYRWFLDSAVLVHGDHRESAEIIGTWMDVTERKRAEKELLASREQLRALAAELAVTEERERHQLATYLHDQIGQALAVLRMKFGALAQAVAFTGVDEDIREIRDLLDQTISDTHSLTLDLSPPILYELGLAPAIEWIGEKIGAEHGLRFVFHDDGRRKPLGDETAPLLFRAARELLMNVVKHGRAECITAQVRRSGEEIAVTIQDDGVGFDPSAPPPNGISRFGLFSIRENMNRIGGRLEVESEPGRGTRATILAPLAKME